MYNTLASNAVTYLHILLILNNTHITENIKIKIICLWQVNESTITNKTKRFGRSSGQTLGAMNHSVENSTHHVDSCLNIKVTWFYKDNSTASFFLFYHFINLCTTIC